MSWLSKAYNNLLWFCGFQKGEHISDMLARQRLRLGVWWWVIAIGTGLGLVYFIIWLIIHIAGHQPRGGV